MGTAYLFTHEAVASGAIVPRFQQEALRLRGNRVAGNRPRARHPLRPDPLLPTTSSARNGRLQAEGRSHEEIREALEWMNIGRLRVASKGMRPRLRDRLRDGDGALPALLRSRTRSSTPAACT